MAQNTGITLLAAALIVGASIVGGALLVRTSVESATVEMSALRTAIEELPGQAPGREPDRRRRPDPARRYSVDTKGSPVRGAKEAKISIVEFSDFQCPFCGRVRPTLDQIEKEYGDSVRIVFKHLPLSIHSKAEGAHRASEAAHRQGKFWEMHDQIFANQRALSDEKYREWATEIGLDLERFERDLADPKLAKRVSDDAAEAARLGVTGTPGFFINGRFLSGAQPFASFKVLIDEELGKS